MDEIADRIINSIIAKRREALIDRDLPEDNITYEESENRLIILAIFVTTVIAKVSFVVLFVTCHTYKIKTLIKPLLVLPPQLQVDNFPVPYVAFMDKFGDGHLVTFKLNRDLNFEFDWTFKVPTQPMGYYIFEDQGDLFVANAKLDMKMTVIQSPLKHGTLAHSNFLQPFYYSASVTRIGEAGQN